ncbi:MAG: hypothetical protein AB1938_11090 [Myxococcota bacterium]
MRKVLLVVALGSTAALATPRPARDTADVGDKGSWSVGIFNPLRIAVHDRVELEAAPLVFFVAPNVNARFAILKDTKPDPSTAPADVKPGLRLTGEFGLSLPTFAMRLTKGYLFPEWKAGADNVGWMLIPRVGVLLSGTVFTHDVWTVRADAAFRIPLGANSAAPLNSFLAPLDILLAAPLTGVCARVGGAYDHAFGDRLRLRGEFNVYVTGGQGNLNVAGASVGPLAAISPVMLSAHLGLDVAVFKQSRITVGVLWANYDTGQTVVVADADGFSRRSPVRSNNFLPTIDYIWAGF